LINPKPPWSYILLSPKHGSHFEGCTRLRIAIIAAGIVGKATGTGLISKGHDIVFYDIDNEKMTQIAAEGYNTTSSIGDAVDRSDVSMICAPTPTVHGSVDLHPLLSICAKVGRALLERDSYHLVVVRSTIPPGTTRGMVIPQIENSAESPIGTKIGVCHNPEFSREKFALADFLNPKAIVIGETDERAGDKLESLYSSFGSPIARCTPETAEMVKYVSNLFNATKISFFNEIDQACKSVGANSEEVSRLMPLLALGLREDLREWGIYGGRPFAGACLPKDLEAFISFMQTRGNEVPLLSAVRQVNESMKRGETKVPAVIANG